MFLLLNVVEVEVPGEDRKGHPNNLPVRHRAVAKPPYPHIFAFSTAIADFAPRGDGKAGAVLFHVDGTVYTVKERWEWIATQVGAVDATIGRPIRSHRPYENEST